MRIFTRSKWAAVEAAEEHKDRNRVERVTDRATQRWHDYQAVKAMIGQCLEDAAPRVQRTIYICQDYTTCVPE